MTLTIEGDGSPCVGLGVRILVHRQEHRREAGVVEGDGIVGGPEMFFGEGDGAFEEGSGGGVVLLVLTDMGEAGDGGDVALGGIGKVVGDVGEKEGGGFFGQAGGGKA